MWGERVSVQPAEGSRRSRRDYSFGLSAIAVGSALAALVVFCWGIGRPAFWVDEAATMQDANLQLSGLRDFLSERDVALAPYYLFMHGWVKLGMSEWWARLPSALAMVLAVAVVVDLARRWWGDRAALGAGLLLVLSPAASRYAQEARPYAIAIAFAVLAVWVLLRTVEGAPGGRRRRWGWPAYALMVTALGLAHFVALVTLLAHPLLVRVARARGEWPVKPLVTATVIGLLPPVLLAGYAFRSRATVSWIEPTDLEGLAAAYAEISGGIPYLVLLTALALLGLRGNGWRLPLLVWFVVPPLVLGLIGLATPLFSARYLLACGPALVLLAAAGVRRASRLQLVGVGVLAAVLAYPSLLAMRAPDGHGPDARTAAEIIAGECEGGVAVRSGVATVRALPFYLDRTDCRVRWVSGPVPAEVERIWVVRPNWGPGPPSPGFGAENFHRIRDIHDVPGYHLTLYTR